MSFYVDQDEQRQKARWAEQRLLEHSQNRAPNGSRGYRSLEEEDDTNPGLPPVFKHDGQMLNARDNSVSRRAARFRDGLPPPPPPALDSGRETPQYLRPAPPPLMSPEEMERRARGGAREDGGGGGGYATQAPPLDPDRFAPHLPPGQTTYDEEDREELEYVRTPLGMVPRLAVSVSIPASLPPSLRVPTPTTAVFQPTQERAPLWQPTEPISLAAPAPPQSRTVLTPSQKKRLRRKKKQQQQQGMKENAQNRQNGHTASLPPPTPTYPDAPLRCDAPVRFRMPDGSLHTLHCPLTPYPHPNQPHLVQLEPANDGTEIFVGWWAPGE